MSSITAGRTALARHERLGAGRRDLVLSSLLSTDGGAATAVARLVLAVVMFPHGAQHLLGWFGGYGFGGTHEWMTATLGFPAALAALAIVTEFVAPLALVAGIGGRVAALGIAGLMVGAASTHGANGFFMNWVGALPAGQEGYEYHVLAIGLALVVVLKGSGSWSVDAVLSRSVSGGEGDARVARRG